MLDEGMKKETIDRAAVDFGMPMGPIELADQVGLDVGMQVGKTLKASFPREVPEIPAWFREKVDKGELGRKTAKGLYDYDGKGRAEEGEYTGARPRDGRAMSRYLHLNTMKLLR